jgi:hypothetical protein
MTVGAHNVALGDLFRDRWPTVRLLDQSTDVVSFVLWVAMIELQDREIANSAIHALSVTKELAQPRPISGLCELVVGCRARFVGRRVADVVHPS